MAIKRYSDPFDKAAPEIGHISMNWSLLESSLDEFICLLAKLEAGPASHVITGNADIRNKVQMLKGLAFIRSFDQDWLNDVIFILDHIDNNLRVRRNDYVHARWVAPKRSHLLKLTWKTKILKPQSFQMVLETEQQVPVKLSQLRELNKDLIATISATFPLFFYMLDGDRLLDPRTSPTISYKQYLRAAGLGNPVKHVRSKQQRLLQSSRAKSQSRRS